MDFTNTLNEYRAATFLVKEATSAELKRSAKVERLARMDAANRIFGKELTPNQMEDVLRGEFNLKNPNKLGLPTKHSLLKNQSAPENHNGLSETTGYHPKRGLSTDVDRRSTELEGNYMKAGIKRKFEKLKLQSEVTRDVTPFNVKAKRRELDNILRTDLDHRKVTAHRLPEHTLIGHIAANKGATSDEVESLVAVNKSRDWLKDQLAKPKPTLNPNGETAKILPFHQSSTAATPTASTITTTVGKKPFWSKGKKVGVGLAATAGLAGLAYAYKKHKEKTASEILDNLFNN